MKAIIGVLRDELLVKLVEQSVAESGFSIAEVISGGADGSDSAEEQCATAQNIPVA